MDPNKLREFISARCVTGEGLVVSRRELRDAFMDWNGGMSVPKGLPGAMEEGGYALAFRVYGPERKSTGVYLGLRLQTQQILPRPQVFSVPRGHVVNVPQGHTDLVLNSLFGEFRGASIKRTDDAPPKISILDVITAITGTVNARKTWADLSRRFEDEGTRLNISTARFFGRGQNDTPVTDASGMITIINNLGGSGAAKFRMRFADILVRYLGGDERLIGEIRGIHDGYEMSQSFRMDSDKLRAFVSARCDAGKGLLVARRELRDAFQAWQGGEPVPRGFSEAVEAAGYTIATRAYGPNRKSTGVYVGLGLRPVVEFTAEVVKQTPSLDDVGAVVSIQPTDLVLDHELFGEFRGARIRKTADVPPKISIIDLIAAVTGALNSRKTWHDLSKRFEEEAVTVGNYFAKFPGQGQNDTPVTDARGVVTIINRLGGTRAGKFREKFADTLVRYLGGDETLIGEIRSIRDAQERLPEDHPLRIFGQTVEVERGTEPADPDCDVQRALKRQKLQNELDEEIERGKKNVRAIKLQDCRETVQAKGEIIEILLAGSAAGLPTPPALLGMLNAARHNFASQAIAQLSALTGDVASGSQGGPPALPAPAAPAATAQRVTVLEVGRDVLRLKSDRLVSSHLSKVGLAVGKRWMSISGNGSLDQNGQNEWERTYKEDAIVRKEAVHAITPDMLARHRIRFSQAYLGTNEVGAGQTFNVWTYPKDGAEELIKDAFATTV
ncbi:hypothetical protein KFL_010830045 [Klebsormidium nitens]|uniref:Uncharacterized protein n=1 Tax=Klebsormidium nitens TaxID=105231 RepID=A0A1Y1IWJ6_KLENI|nr:hypothetical protein KFL_010830045 [Klebsormidium nitens]|eukprot:GAQ92648.1 hypothetical protein KFL_010830045 [Klebsormidium nitens]